MLILVYLFFFILVYLLLQDDFVLCKVYKKNGPGPKIGEQYGSPFEEEEEEMNDANGDAYCLSHSSAPGPRHGGVFNSAGQSVSDCGRVSLSLLSAKNGKSSSSGVRPDRASRPDVNWDRIHIQQLADIMGCLSTNPVGQDCPSVIFLSLSCCLLHAHWVN